MNSEQWFYITAGEKRGPVDAVTLVSLASAGVLVRTDLIWKQGLPDWRPASEFPEICPPFAPQSTPAAPPLPSPPPPVPSPVTTTPRRKTFVFEADAPVSGPPRPANMQSPPPAPITNSDAAKLAPAAPGRSPVRESASPPPVRKQDSAAPKTNAVRQPQLAKAPVGRGVMFWFATISVGLVLLAVVGFWMLHSVMRPQRIKNNTEAAVVILNAIVDAQETFKHSNDDGQSRYADTIAKLTKYLAWKDLAESGKAGYRFKVLRGKGNGHAALAYPEQYGETGFITLMISSDGSTYSADLGAGTPEVAGAMEILDPDPAIWTNMKSGIATTTPTQESYASQTALDIAIEAVFKAGQDGGSKGAIPALEKARTALREAPGGNVESNITKLQDAESYVGSMVFLQELYSMGGDAKDPNVPIDKAIFNRAVRSTSAHTGITRERLLQILKPHYKVADDPKPSVVPGTNIQSNTNRNP